MPSTTLTNDHEVTEGPRLPQSSLYCSWCTVLLDGDRPNGRPKLSKTIMFDLVI